MTIHREGHSLLLVLAVLLLIINLSLHFLQPDNQILRYTVLGISIGFYLIILQFFRSPSVRTVLNPRHIIAPADGKVVVIEEVVEPEYFKDRRLQVSIFMSPINVHVNRSPLTGMVQYVKYHAGKYLVAWHPKASTENERTSIVIRHDNGTDILMRQIAGALAKRIKWYVNEGERIEQGDEFGFIKFGSRVDLFLPLTAKVKVKIGDVTSAGESVVAEL